MDAAVVQHMEDKLLIIPCSGESYLGRLTETAAKELADREGALSVNLIEFSDPDQSAITLSGGVRSIGVEGCEQRCVAQLLNKHGCEVEFHLVLTDLGIENTDGVEIQGDDLQLAKDAIVSTATRVKDQVPVLPGCCCS